VCQLFLGWTFDGWTFDGWTFDGWTFDSTACSGDFKVLESIIQPSHSWLAPHSCFSPTAQGTSTVRAHGEVVRSIESSVR